MFLPSSNLPFTSSFKNLRGINYGEEETIKKTHWYNFDTIDNKV